MTAGLTNEMKLIVVDPATGKITQHVPFPPDKVQEQAPVSAEIIDAVSYTHLDVYKRQHMNRVTDTCIPEGEAMRRMEKAMLEVWTDADKKGERYFPHEFFYKVLLSGKYEKYYQIDPKDSWMLAAAKKNLPIVVPGWEDATLGNMYAAAVIRGDVKNVHTVRTGIEYLSLIHIFPA